MENRESVKREAYSKALKFKNTGLDEESIYGRLEKLGFPEDICKEVAKNVLMKKLEDKEKNLPETINRYTIIQKLIRELFK